MTDGPGEIVKPLGSAFLELAKLPITMVNDMLPELQVQVKQLPELVRTSGQQFVQQAREAPQNFKAQMESTRGQVNLGQAAFQAISPFPFVTRPPTPVQEEKK